MQDKSKRMCEFFTEGLKESAHTNPREGGAENGLDVHAYRCVVVATRNRKNTCVHHPHFVRLSLGPRD